MRAITVSFDRGNDDYSRLLNVFRKSWEDNSPIPLDVKNIPAPKTGKRNYPYVANTRKLEVWANKFNQDTIFVDCDMLCLRCPSTGFDYVENIGICERSHTAPFNGGVMFLKYTEYSKSFLKSLVEINTRMLDNVTFHKKYNSKYAGLNQSAMGYLFENGYSYDTVPESYNLCPPFEEWKHAHLIHCKMNHLRNMCLYPNDGPEPLKEVAQIWKSYDSK